MKRTLLILIMIGLVVMIGALYWEGLSLAEEKPASGVTEQTQAGCPCVRTGTNTRPGSPNRILPGSIPEERPMWSGHRQVHRRPMI